MYQKIKYNLGGRWGTDQRQELCQQGENNPAAHKNSSPNELKQSDYLP